MSVLIPEPGEQASVARLLIDAITLDQPTAWIEIRHGARRADGTLAMTSEWFGGHGAPQAVKVAHDLASTREVYVGLQPRQVRGDGSSASAVRGRVVFADCDTDEALERLRTFTPRPSFVTRSGGRTESGAHRVHAVWITQAVHHFERELAPIVHRLIAHLGSDPACKDAARVARLPGTRSHKHDAPVECIYVNCAPVHLADLDAALPALPEPAVTRAPSVPRIDHDDPLRGIPAAEYVEALTGLHVPRSGMVNCPLPGHEDRTPSFHVGGRDPFAWRCHGCGHGGGIYELAAALAHVPTPLRGATFLEVRSALMARLGRAA